MHGVVARLNPIIALIERRGLSLRQSGALSHRCLALAHLRTGTPTIQLEGLVDRAVLKARGVRGVVWVHLAGMRVPADQGPVRHVSPRAGFRVLEL